LAVVARYYSDGEVHEDIFCLKPMYSNTKGKDILDTFTEHVQERQIDIEMFSVTIPAMIGQHRGFVTLAEQKIGHPVMKLHCIVHQENLCVKISNAALDDAMSTVTKIVTSLSHALPQHTDNIKTPQGWRSWIWSQFALLGNRFQFRSFLEEMESAFHDVPLHCSVRWLSPGEVFLRFVERLAAIRAFLIGKARPILNWRTETDLWNWCFSWISLHT